MVFILYMKYTREGFEDVSARQQYYYDVKQRVYTKMLSKISKIFKKLKIPIFLSSGTLLGYYRDNKFMDHDYDIDLGIFQEDYNDIIIDEMENNGFYLYRTLGNRETGLELSFYYKGTRIGKRAKVDIFLHYREPNGKIFWTSYEYPKFIKRLKYQVSDFKLKKVTFKEIEIYVPDPTLRYVEEHYGDDWMIPKIPFKTYFYNKSPTSLVKDDEE